MNNLITDRNLMIVNFAIVLYFIQLWLINYYKLDFVLIGVFVELLTIPFLLAQIVLLAVGIKYVIQNKINVLTIISVVSLAVCAIFTIGQFF